MKIFAIILTALGSLMTVASIIASITSEPTYNRLGYKVSEPNEMQFIIVALFGVALIIAGITMLIINYRKKHKK